MASSMCWSWRGVPGLAGDDVALVDDDGQGVHGFSGGGCESRVEDLDRFLECALDLVDVRPRAPSMRGGRDDEFAVQLAAGREELVDRCVALHGVGADDLHVRGRLTGPTALTA